MSQRETWSKASTGTSSLRRQQQTTRCKVHQPPRKVATKTRAIVINSKSLNLFPPEIVQQIKTKRRAVRKFQKTHDPSDKAEANRLHALVRKQIAGFKEAKWRSFCDELNSLRSSDSTLWRKLNSICGSGKKKSSQNHPQLKRHQYFPA